MTERGFVLMLLVGGLIMFILGAGQIADHPHERNMHLRGWFVAAVLVVCGIIMFEMLFPGP